MIIFRDFLKLEVDFAQSNVEGELVNIIQNSRKKYDGMIINAAAFTHTSVAIRDALDLFKKPLIMDTENLESMQKRLQQ